MNIKFNMNEGDVQQSQLEKDLERIFREYFSLKKKFDNIEEQSWYFKQGLNSNTNKINSLIREYESIRVLINGSTIQELKNKLEGFEKEKRLRDDVLISMYRRFDIDRSIRLYKDLILLKSRINQLMPIEYYKERWELFMVIDNSTKHKLNDN